jgi:hypothetical protein
MSYEEEDTCTRQLEELHLVQQDDVIGSKEPKQSSQLRD